MTEEEKIKYDNWNAHLTNTRDRTNYALRRMDLLIISISGGGIFLIFQILKTQAAGQIILDSTSLLKFSGLVFLLSIIANFASQITGYRANDFEEKYTIQQISNIEGNEIDKCQQKIYDSKSIYYTKATNILNMVSTVLMFLGLILLVYFNYTLF
ncbi:hypothetical protein [Dokdonia sp.]|uniref:hypothetical protein n=1 Tax=Dokdonia sp. TaxID=2024995 RepID=UPI003266B376